VQRSQIVPVKKRIIRVPLLPSQRRFLESASPVKGFSGPVGSGKTYALCYQALCSAAENPGCKGLLGAPTWDMLADITIPVLLELLELHKIRHTCQKSAHAVTFDSTGSRILLHSLDRPARLRGLTLAWAGVDELTYCKKEAWECLEARVRDPKARTYQMFGVWTPNGYDWVHKRFISPNRIDDHQAIIAAPGENLAVLSRRPDYYDQLKKSYSEPFFRQEALGEYLNTKTGRAYEAWSEANLDASLRFEPGHGLCWALDFNVDPLAGLLAQFVDGRIHVLKELFLRNSGTQEMCERFAQIAQPLAERYREENRTPLPITLYGDSTAQARSTSSRTDYELIREFFRSRGQFKLELDIPRTNPPVRDRVNTVNAMLRNAAGDVRTRVHPDCRELINDFQQATWKQGSPNFELDKTSDKMRTHLTDALGYMVCRLAPINGFRRQITLN
jgi:Terminase large subunit, T4likevirus-type, N-terminal/Terminase RNaseH-like domain